MSGDDKNGEGMAVYVKGNLNYDVIDKITKVILGHSCIMVKVFVEMKKKYVLVSCIYKGPGSDMDIFRVCFKETFKNVN